MAPPPVTDAVKLTVLQRVQIGMDKAKTLAQLARAAAVKREDEKRGRPPLPSGPRGTPREPSPLGPRLVDQVTTGLKSRRTSAAGTPAARPSDRDIAKAQRVHSAPATRGPSPTRVSASGSDRAKALLAAAQALGAQASAAIVPVTDSTSGGGGGGNSGGAAPAGAQ
jgi:hypothetical protein